MISCTRGWRARTSGGFNKLGARVTVCGPSTLMPAGIEKLDVKVSNDIDELIRESDVLMLLRLQQERQENQFLPSIGNMPNGSA